MKYTRITLSTVFFLLVLIVPLLAANQQRERNRSYPLTENQINIVKSILSNYNSSSLSKEDAMTIKRTLKERGVRNGPELDDALRNAGFDPEEIEKLAEDLEQWQ